MENNVKFEGSINGKKFTNVKDYNEALISALNRGEQVEASSRTYTEVEKVKEHNCNCNRKDCGCGRCECEKKPLENIDFLPGFSEICRSASTFDEAIDRINKDCTYVDNVVDKNQTDREFYGSSIHKVAQQLDRAVEYLVNDVIGDLNPEAQTNLMKLISAVIDKLNSDKICNFQTENKYRTERVNVLEEIAKLEQKVASIDEKMVLLKREKAVMDTYENKYKKLYNEAREVINTEIIDEDDDYDYGEYGDEDIPGVGFDENKIKDAILGNMSPEEAKNLMSRAENIVKRSMGENGQVDFNKLMKNLLAETQE